MKRTAIRIYWLASLLAIIEAFVLFIFGLDLRVEQVRLFAAIPARNPRFPGKP